MLWTIMHGFTEEFFPVGDRGGCNELLIKKIFIACYFVSFLFVGAASYASPRCVQWGTRIKTVSMCYINAILWGISPHYCHLWLKAGGPLVDKHSSTHICFSSHVKQTLARHYSIKSENVYFRFPFEGAPFFPRKSPFLVPPPPHWKTPLRSWHILILSTQSGNQQCYPPNLSSIASQ